MDPKKIYNRSAPLPEILIAVRNGDAASVKRLMAADSRNFRPRSPSESMLKVASELGKSNVVEALLPYSSKDDLLEALRNAGTREIAEILLANGADFQQISKFCLLSAPGSNIEIARLFLERGADINAASTGNGYTPLHFAAHKAYPELAKFLIDHGAQLEARDEDGHTPLHIAIWVGKFEKDPKSKEIVELLLREGADLHAPDKWGKSPLHTAVIDNPDWIETLLSHGARIDFEDFAGRTALHWAIILQRTEAISVLRRHGASEWIPTPRPDSGALPPELTYIASQLEKRVQESNYEDDAVTISPEEWNSLPPVIRYLVPDWLEKLLASHKLVGWFLEFTDLSDDYPVLVGFPSVEGFPTFLDFKSDLIADGFISFAWAGDANRWLTRVGGGPMSPVYFFDHSAWEYTQVAENVAEFLSKCIVSK